MERRKFIIGAGSLAAGGAAAIGSGAFSSVEAERSLSVSIADDDTAYLKFDTDLGNSPDDNYEYSEISNDEMSINFGTNDAGGQGVNPNAVNHFDDVFALMNQGTEPVKIWFELGGGLDEYLDVYPIAGGEQRDNSLVGEANAFSASWATGVGSTLRLGLKIDTTKVADENEFLEGSITVHAEEIDPEQ
jgi:hypothetical protein